MFWINIQMMNIMLKEQGTIGKFHLSRMILYFFTADCHKTPSFFDHDQSHVLDLLCQSVENTFMNNETLHEFYGVSIVVMLGSHYFEPHLDLDVIDCHETSSSIKHKLPYNVDRSLEKCKDEYY